MKQRFVKDGEIKIECIIKECYENKFWNFYVQNISKRDKKYLPSLLLEEHTVFIANSENKLVSLVIATDNQNINKNTIKTLSLQECYKKFDKFEKTVAYFNKIVKQIEY